VAESQANAEVLASVAWDLVSSHSDLLKFVPRDNMMRSSGVEHVYGLDKSTFTCHLLMAGTEFDLTYNVFALFLYHREHWSLLNVVLEDPDSLSKMSRLLQRIAHGITCDGDPRPYLNTHRLWRRALQEQSGETGVLGHRNLRT
jgi:hypothetical protein